MWALVHRTRPGTFLTFSSALAAEWWRREWMLDEFVVRPYEGRQP